MNGFDSYTTDSKNSFKTPLPAKWQTNDYLKTLIGYFPFCMEKHFKLCLRIKTDLTKILNPITKPKPKTQHSFRLHEDLIHQSFPSSTYTLTSKKKINVVCLFSYQKYFDGLKFEQKQKINFTL